MSLSKIERKPRLLGVTTSVIFDMSEPDALWRTEQNGDKAPGTYAEYMRDKIDYDLKPGPMFDFIAAWSQRPDHQIILMSKNSMITGVRAMSSLLNVGVIPDQFVFTNGRSPNLYMPYYRPNKFLTTNFDDAWEAQNKYSVASALFDHKNPEATVDFVKDTRPVPLYRGPQLIRAVPAQSSFNNKSGATNQAHDKISIAYDADGVVFDRSSEEIYQNYGLADFRAHERENVNVPLQPGPHWDEFVEESKDTANYITHLVTSRGAEALIRVGKTFVRHGIESSGEAHGLNGAKKIPLIEIMKKRYGPSTTLLDDSKSKIQGAEHHGVSAGLVPTAKPRDPAA